MFIKQRFHLYNINHLYSPLTKTKPREELKKCREHIEELQREHKAVISQLEESEKQNNTAALYRLKAAKERIYLEIDNELQLQKQIANTLDKAEYVIYLGFTVFFAFLYSG